MELPIRRIQIEVSGDLSLPTVSIRQQPGLVVIELLAGLRRIFKVRTFDDGVHRARFLAQAAINAFHHIDVIAHGSPSPVVPPRSSFDRDRLRRADSLAQLAGNAALFPVGIAPQSMLAAKPR